jgi:hypothetical protein
MNYRQITSRVRHLGITQNAAQKEYLRCKQSPDEIVLESRSARIRTQAQLIAECQVDLSQWDIASVEHNKWEVGRKDKQVDLTWEAGLATGTVRDSGKIHVEPLWQIKIRLVPKGSMRKNSDVIKEALAETTKTLLAMSKEKPVRYTKTGPEEGCLFEVSTPDLHIGKLAWKAETGQPDYDLQLARTDMHEALEALVGYAARYPITRILFPVGNDYFNVDNDTKSTNAGTSQDEDGRFQKSFRVGVSLAVDAIIHLREIAPVQVLIVQGNHDYQRCFYLGEVLHARFHNMDGVDIDNAPTQRKYFCFGKNLVGFTHGDRERPITLPQIMAQERPSEWAATRFHEWHLGHFHKKEDKLFQPLSEEGGVRMRYIPSLAPADSWHARQGYLSQRAAEAFLWHPTRGCIANFSHHPTRVS